LSAHPSFFDLQGIVRPGYNRRQRGMYRTCELVAGCNTLCIPTPARGRTMLIKPTDACPNCRRAWFAGPEAQSATAGTGR
jgi:hypothetical protein